jgi:membrane-associated phospholipid phosphatase
MHPRLSCGAAAAVITVLSPSVARASPPSPQAPRFAVDPVADGVVTATSEGFALLLGAVLSTGEIRPRAPTSDPSVLLPIDRAAVTSAVDRSAGTFSDVIQWSATAFAVLDPILTGARDGWDALVVDAVMYAESTALTAALTDILKIAVRRPRPFDYAEPSTTNTDATLSFPSGHASGVAAVAATATYLAFVRSPNTARPWITLAIGAVLTSLVGVERVRAGAHFPTDVIAGSILGGSVGVLVPHLHEHETPLVWVGIAPSPDGSGGGVSIHGHF